MYLGSIQKEGNYGTETIVIRSTLIDRGWRGLAAGQIGDRPRRELVGAYSHLALPADRRRTGYNPEVVLELRIRCLGCVGYRRRGAGNLLRAAVWMEQTTHDI